MGGKTQLYCHACAMKIYEHNYCHICYQIAMGDGDWICCDICLRWNHMICEEKKSGIKGLKAKLDADPDMAWTCTHCRKSNGKEKKKVSMSDRVSNESLKSEVKTSVDIGFLLENRTKAFL